MEVRIGLCVDFDRGGEGGSHRSVGSCSNFHTNRDLPEDLIHKLRVTAGGRVKGGALFSGRGEHHTAQMLRPVPAHLVGRA